MNDERVRFNALVARYAHENRIYKLDASMRT